MSTTPPLAPAISVVIPMYNAEKYIGACLESLLAQTFKDFEVIVVDDCSTDNSATIIESYIPKFGGRLKLLHMDKNTGGPGLPTNRGINFSRGKYIYTMDNDDLLVNTALEELYNFAENYQADVVYMDKGFLFATDAEKPFPAPENLKIAPWQQGAIIDRPTFEPDDTAERISKICNGRFGWPAWQKLVRRDLLMENAIDFPNLRSSADCIWTFKIVFYAKKILRIPAPLYVYRSNQNSLTRKKRTPQDEISFWMGITASGIKILGEWIYEQRFFRDNPQIAWALLESFERNQFLAALKVLQQLPPAQSMEFLKSAFTEKFGEYGNLLAYFCTSSNLAHLGWLMANQRVIELENQLKQIQGG